VDLPLGQLMKIKIGALPAKGAPPIDVPAPKASPVRVLIVEKPTPATAVSLGYPYELRRGHPHFYLMMLGTSILGEHRQTAGRLFEELRTKRGLNYGDYAYPEAFVQDGWSTYALPNVPRRLQHFSIWLRPIETKHAVFALRAALNEATKLQQRGVTQEEMDNQRAFLDGYTRLWEQTDSRRLGQALDEIFYGPRNHLGAFREAMKRMKLDQVNAVLKKYLRPDQLRMAFVTGNGAALKQALVSGQPSPIQYPSAKPPGVLAEDKLIAAFPLKLRPEEVKVVKASELFVR